MWALPFIGITVIALTALEIVYGAKLTARLLQQLFDRIPITGSKTIGRFVVAVVDTAVAGIEAILSAAAAPAVNLILAGPRAIGVLLDDIVTAADTLYWQVVHTAEAIVARFQADVHYLADRIDTVAYQLGSLIAADAHYLADRIDTVAYQLGATIAADAHYLAGRIDTVEAEARALITSTGHYVMTVLAGELARVDAALTYLAGRIDTVTAAAVTAARGYALEAEHAAIATVDSTAAAVAGTVWPDITADADALAGELATDLPDLRALVDAIPRVRPLDLADALAGAATVDAVLVKYLRDCGVPNCRNLGKFGHDLQALFGLVEDGALFALLAALITDPGDTVRPLHDFLAPLAGDAVAAGRALAGV